MRAKKSSRAGKISLRFSSKIERFYTGESGFLDGLAHTQAETAEDFLPFIDSATYYGCFTVFDSDVAWITEWPITSHGTAVVLESGTYADLMTLVHTQTKGEIP